MAAGEMIAQLRLAAALLFGSLLANSGPLLGAGPTSIVRDDAGDVGIEGSWTNPSQSVQIQIGRCGEYYCGTVQWASEKAKEDARKGTDPLVGAQLLSDVSQRPNGRWQGWLFVPDKNKRVRASIRLADRNHLKISGCLVGRTLCRSQTWTRTPRQNRDEGSSSAVSAPSQFDPA